MKEMLTDPFLHGAFSGFVIGIVFTVFVMVLMTGINTARKGKHADKVDIPKTEESKDPEE